MDQSITLRHASTEQECTFADREQAEHFTANVEHAGDWQTIGGAAPADEQPHGTIVSVDLGELRQAVAADTAAHESAGTAAAVEADHPAIAAAKSTSKKHK